MQPTGYDTKGIEFNIRKRWHPCRLKATDVGLTSPGCFELVDSDLGKAGIIDKIRLSRA